MNFNYNNNNKEEETYEALNEYLDYLIDKFGFDSEEFEEEYMKQVEEYNKQHKSEEKNEKSEWNGSYHYLLDDGEIKMVNELGEKMNCSWNYVVGQALDWYYMAVMEGVVENNKKVEEKSEELNEAIEPDMVNRPHHYTSGKIETIDKIERVIHGLPAEAALRLGNVLRYFDRAGLKDDAEQDLDKANNYAYRLVYDMWRDEVLMKR